ncbi:hypothetical protein [Lentzea sp. NBRC 105346]|uniref:hypothetical protein n=1 Tax=Lentzea sp. NBRC 105346 TaxID=3032205 RepID=UPI00255521B3|nr:hypothetical protein [Lentzea sp. NBRC 105346]
MAAAAALIGFTATPAQANHSWGGYHWPRTNVAQLTLYSSITSDWSGALSTANSDWNKSQYLENTIVASDTSRTTRRQCRMPAGAIRVCNYTYGQNGWAGLASINLYSGTKHISQATTKINDTYLANADAAKRQGVMCQEVGHDFGLDHQDEDFNNPNLGTCMDYTNNWNTNQHPNQHDYDQLAAIYNHSDGSANQAAEAGVTTIRTGDTVTLITWAS